VVGVDYEAPTPPFEPNLYITMAGAAALIMGGTMAIVSGPDGPETVVSYDTDRPRRLRA